MDALNCDQTIEDVKNELDYIINCDICENILETPVLLPCKCSAMCKKHEIEIKDNTRQSETARVICPRCRVEHKIPEKGFYASRDLTLFHKMVKLRMNLRDENETCLGVHHELAVETYKYLKDLFDEFKSIRDNPELEFDRVIEELKNKIDLRREEIKKKIDDEALDLIEEIDNYKEKNKPVYNDQFTSNLSKDV